MDPQRAWTAAELLLDAIIVVGVFLLADRLWKKIPKKFKPNRFIEYVLFSLVVGVAYIVIEIPAERVLNIGRAMDGDQVAQATLGIQDLNGKIPSLMGVGPDIPWFHSIDYGLYWLTKAAAQGEPTAQACLGFTYLDPVHGRTRQAPELLLDAIQNPQTNQHIRGQALWALGRAFLTGENVDQDFRKARICFEAGDSLDNALSTFELGKLFRDGNGVDQDADKADKYFKRAAKLGCTERDGKPHLDMDKINPPPFVLQDKH